VCLTHDIDNVNRYSIKKYNRWRKKKLNHSLIKSNKWGIKIYEYAKYIAEVFAGTAFHSQGMFKQDPRSHYHKLYKIENKLNVGSTTFIPPSESSYYADPQYKYSDKMEFDGEKVQVKDMIQDIEDMGNEIGLHAGYMAVDDVEVLKAQKEQLEAIVENSIDSIRHHHLHYDITKTPTMHNELDIKFDSSLGIKSNIGFRFGTSYPWRLFDHTAEQKSTVLELPLIIGDILVKSNGMGLSDDVALGYVDRISDTVKNVGGVLTVLWHPSKTKDHIRMYQKVIKLLKQKDPYFGTISEIGEVWENKNLEKFDY
jgi:peptidoglycan/xylan/chitin deacetylase (PgdA/CDA1 family)